MISYEEVKAKSRRHNHDENVWVHPFSGRLATPFSWLFINFGMSANQVTVVFFICGIAAALVQPLDTFSAAVASFVLFRLHVLFDVCDGEVARFRQQISKWGVYWDQLIHFFTYPLIASMMGFGRLQSGAELWVMLPVVGLMLFKVLDLAAKNLYHRVRSQSPKDTEQVAVVPVGGVSRRPRLVKRIVMRGMILSGFDGLLFFYALAYLAPAAHTGLSVETRDIVLVLYALAFFLVALVRIVLIPLRGIIPKRGDRYSEG